MSKLDTLEEIMDEVEEGLERLDKPDYWTCNSHTASLLVVSFLLLMLVLTCIPHRIYYTLKFKVYWRIKFRRLL